jgi:hypothetical protein
MNTLEELREEINKGRAQVEYICSAEDGLARRLHVWSEDDQEHVEIDYPVLAEKECSHGIVYWGLMTDDFAHESYGLSTLERAAEAYVFLSREEGCKWIAGECRCRQCEKQLYTPVKR